MEPCESVKDYIQKVDLQGVKCILIDPPRLVNPSWSDGIKKILRFHDINPPMGLAYIAGVLREAGAKVKILDARSLSMPHNEVLRIVEKNRPDYVGITAVTPQMKSALYLSKLIKESCLDTKIILGGPHVHFEHEAIIRESDVIDFCVRGEGELTLLELIKTLREKGKLEKVRGITFRRGKRVIVTPDRPFIKDLDSLPYPARDLLPNHIYKYSKFGLNWTVLLAQRGCPYRCHFCSNHAMWRYQRRRSVENVLDEIEYCRRRFHVEYIKFADDVFVIDKKWVAEFCKGLIERGLDDIRWACDCRVDLLSEDILRKMAEANCETIFFGLEFGNQRILDLCEKGFTIPQIYRAIKATKKAGISPCGYFMIGYPTETRETIMDTINLAKDLILNYGLDYAGFSIVTPYPGTRLYEYCKKRNILKTCDHLLHPREGYIEVGGKSAMILLPYPPIKLENLTDEELIELYRKAHEEVAKAFEERRQKLSGKSITYKSNP